MEVALGPWGVRGDLPVVFAAAFDDDVLLVLLRWVLVEDAVVLEELDLALGCEVLVAEEDNATLRNEKRQFVKLLGRER